MMQLIRLIKRLGLTAAILCVAIAIFVFTGMAKSDSQAQPAIVTNYTNVGAIALLNNSGNIGIILDEQGTPSIIDAQASHSTDKLKSFIVQLSNITAEKSLGTVKDLSVFGLDKPLATAKLLFDNGSTLQLFLGMANPIDGSYYLKRSDSDTVYTVGQSLGDLMQLSADGFRDFELFPGLDRKALLNLEAVSVTSEYGSFKLVREAAGAEVALFSLASPFRGALDWQRADQQVLVPISKLVPTDFVSDNVPLAQYALDKPTKILSLNYGGKTVSVGFSDAGQEDYYCADLSKQEVFLCKKESAPFLQQSYSMLLGDSIYYGNLAEVSYITILSEGKRYSMEVQGTGEGLNAKTGTKLLSTVDATAFFSAITTIPIADEIKSSVQVSMQSSLSIIISKRNGTTDIIDFIPMADRRCAVVVNGQANFTTYSSVASDILSISEYTLLPESR